MFPVQLHLERTPERLPDWRGPEAVKRAARAIPARIELRVRREKKTIRLAKETQWMRRGRRSFPHRLCKWVVGALVESV